jgi:hypothetical protein
MPPSSSFTSFHCEDLHSCLSFTHHKVKKQVRYINLPPPLSPSSPHQLYSFLTCSSLITSPHQSVDFHRRASPTAHFYFHRIVLVSSPQHKKLFDDIHILQSFPHRITDKWRLSPPRSSFSAVAAILLLPLVSRSCPTSPPDSRKT